MVREDLLSDPLTYKKSRNRNVTTTTPPRFDKKQRGKSADRGNLLSISFSAVSKRKFRQIVSKSDFTIRCTPAKMEFFSSFGSLCIVIL